MNLKRERRLAGGGIGGITMKMLAMRRFEGKISMRYNRLLSKPRNLVLRLENEIEVREYRCSGLKLKNDSKSYFNQRFIYPRNIL